MGRGSTVGRLLGGAALALAALVAVPSGPAGAAAPTVSTITMVPGRAYTPKAPPGATDDYHCTLVNPHVTHNSFIVAAQFFPHSPEVHHAIVFLVPPNVAAQAEAADHNGQGWTCFGESALPDTIAGNHISNTPWLTAWAPGRGQDVEPTGTGVPFPAGSLVVMQVHYNLLVGDKPVRATMQLKTVPASTPLRPSSLDLMPAPPDLPCPAGVTGPLCSRATSLVNLGQRFGQGAVFFVDFLERFCGRSVTDPPAGDSTSCVWPVGRSGIIVRLGAHMHLLGRTMTIILDPGTPRAKTLLDVADFNFHDQRSYNLKVPVPVTAGDTIGVTCSYDPTLAQELPILRKVPAHFVTWGDGSSDEMCLALVQMIPPATEAESVARSKAFSPNQYPSI
jgi:hypothetical protein